ncbi:MAG TPA: hypothetical protein VFR68_09255 [Candidatus Dormibacteraeota bacterium]|nr:hypothetical protein [Candidatus Dormibacteraeota bacterium]
MTKHAERETITVDLDEYEFFKVITETVDEFLNAPFPRVREDAVEWLKDTLGDELGDDDTKSRQARLDEADCEECRKYLVQAFAWKERQRRIEPAPVLTLHRHGDKIN